MKNRLAFAFASALPLLPAFAQGEDGTSELEEIVVTGALERQPEAAGRLGLTNRETPAIVDVITQTELQVQGVRNTIEALNAAPGIASGALPGSLGSVSMRGFHRAANFLFDGVRMATSDVGVRNWDAWSFERIEIIKGPASVTSGEGALAGAINYVPRQPDFDESTTQVLASYGSFATERLAADFNLPISDTVATRVNAAWSQTDGWIDDTDSDTAAVSGAVTIRPGERLSATLRADYFEDNYSTIYYGTPLVSTAVAREPSDAVSGSAGLVLDKAMRHINFNVLDGDTNSDTLWLRANAEYQLTDAITLVSDTSWYSADRRWQDSDEYGFNAGSGLIDRYMTLITHDHNYWNQRLHLAFDGVLAGRRNRFTIGTEIGSTDFFTVRRFGTAASVDPLDPDRGSFAADTPLNFGTRQNVSADVKAWALFAENAIDLTDKWLLAAGLRIDEFELDRSVLSVDSNALQNYGQDYDAVSWRLGTVYSLTPRTQLFAQYSHAVTPVTGLLFMSSTNSSFELTTGRSYEVGVKTSLTGQGVELTASAFDIRQDDILTRDPTDPTVVYQGGNLQSSGVEFAINWPATDELDIGLSASFLDAKYGQLIEGGGANRAGNLPPNVPENVADLVATFTPSRLPISVTGVMRYNGGIFTSNANTVRIDSFTTIDAAIAWTTSRGSLTLRGRNLTDEFYADWSGYSPGLVFVGAPRSAELAFVATF